MGREFLEREFDDEVYEDGFYEENLDEEEIDESSELFFDERERRLADEGEGEPEEGYSEKKIYLSFACEDCDYRWDDAVVKKEGNLEDEIVEEDLNTVCPMCGSMNVSQI